MVRPVERLFSSGLFQNRCKPGMSHVRGTGTSLREAAGFAASFANRLTSDSRVTGGSFENRIRFLLETIDAIRREWRADLPLFVRISATDWVEGGWNIEDSVHLCRILKERGDVDLVDYSSGGNDPAQRMPSYPGYYQVPFAERLRGEAMIATAAVGLISAPEAAEEIIANQRADLVTLGRILLFDPYWPLHAAKALKSNTVSWPLQYERANIF